MKPAYSLGLVLLCTCILVWNTQATPIEYGDDEEHVDNLHRERRDMHGLFDLIGDIFKTDKSTGKSQAGSIFDALLKSMGAMGKKLEESVGSA